MIELIHYLSDAAKVSLIRGAAAVIAAANTKGIPVVLVTNQSGIGRGRYGWAEFAAVQDTLHRAIKTEDAYLDAVYACPHLPGALLPEPGDDPPCRKPNPGMLLRAARDFGLDLSASWIAGDAVSDLEAGKRAGLARGLLVTTGYGARDEAAVKALADARFSVTTGKGIGSLIGELAGIAI